MAGGECARLELGDGAYKGLLGALEQLREPAAQAAVALRGGGKGKGAGMEA